MLSETEPAGAVDHEHFMASWHVAFTIVNIVCCSQTTHKKVLLNAHKPGR